jgi:hypothetical protein
VRDVLKGREGRAEAGLGGKPCCWAVALRPRWRAELEEATREAKWQTRRGKIAWLEREAGEQREKAAELAVKVEGLENEERGLKAAWGERLREEQARLELELQRLELEVEVLTTEAEAGQQGSSCWRRWSCGGGKPGVGKRLCWQLRGGLRLRWRHWGLQRWSARQKPAGASSRSQS